MLIPVVLLYAIICSILLVIGIRKKNQGIFAVLNLLFWLAAASSALAIWWAWKDRMYSENWAFMGVVFYSFPMIVITSALAIVSLIALRRKKMIRMRIQQVSLWLLLLLLAAQAVLGVLSGT